MLFRKQVFLCLYLTLISTIFSSYLLMDSSITENNTTPKIYMVLRYDDFANDSKFEVEPNLFGIAAHYNFPISVAIVAHFGTDPEEVDFIKPYIKNGTVEVASHGLRHAYFPKLSYEEQCYRLKKSREILEEIYNVTIETFVAPGNAYTNDTLHALQELGYKVFSADKEWHRRHSSTIAQIKDESTLYPHLIYSHNQWMPWNVGIENFKSLINKYRSSLYYLNSSKALLLCTHFHGVNFQEYPHDERLVPVPKEWIQSNYTEFNDFLSYLKEQNDLEVVTFNQLIKISEDVDLLNLDLKDPLPQISNSNSFDNYIFVLTFLTLTFCIVGITTFLYLIRNKISKRP